MRKDSIFISPRAKGQIFVRILEIRLEVMLAFKYRGVDRMDGARPQLRPLEIPHAANPRLL